MQPSHIEQSSHIKDSFPSTKTQSWRMMQKKSITSFTALYALHNKTVPKNILESTRTPAHFPLLLPLRLAKKINLDDPLDPLLLQFVPSNSLTNQIEPVKDPLAEMSAQITPRLLKKYSGRTLFLPTSACAMHCRYCFRQEYPYEKSSPSKLGVQLFYQDELAAIKKDSSIQEVILSGGDPLSLSNAILHDIIQELESIPHIRRVRWHTRFLIGIPERVDEGLLKIFTRSHLTHYMVLHINHPREIDVDFSSYLKKLRFSGVTLLAQAVLLHQVNDHIDTLHELSESLSNAGVLFYYLHQIDPIEAACPFWVPPQKGKDLINALRERTSGYGVPTYVSEIAYEKSKTPL